MDIAIKNMVCPRCIQAVEQAIHELGFQPVRTQLGLAQLADPLDSLQLQQLNVKLKSLGFEIVDDPRNQLVEKIKAIIITHIHHLENGHTLFSEVLSNELNKEYSQLSKLFSTRAGITIEQFIILQKIEKVKELLAYQELTLSEIAYKMGYSSVAHLSAQFKKITELTPSQFKAHGSALRQSLDSIGDKKEKFTG
ncbi:transcriptional regulator, AraC family [bacterium A37T11]|nr:transcriptional regulator, AraC family [bacterium A37T11]